MSFLLGAKPLENIFIQVRFSRPKQSNLFNNMRPQINSALEPFLVKAVTRMGGFNFVFKFDNKYGASVVCHENSYGGRQGLWELAVLDADLNITYETPITQDVLGWLEWERVLDILFQISRL